MNFSMPALAQNLPVAHWINDEGQNGATVLNASEVFTTDFKRHNDLIVTPVTSDPVTLATDVFGGSSPGNNPAYVTNFMGVATNGTGDGVVGDIGDLNMTLDATGTVQFDFLLQLTPLDRILMIDVDGPEQYLLQAYDFNGSSYVPVSLMGWTAENFSGTTGITPNSQWPVWNPGSGTLTSGTSADLDEDLVVLTPDQKIDRLVITKQAGSGWSTDVTFLSLQESLAVQSSGTNVVFSWDNPAFILQTAPSLTGVFTNLSTATSPYTNAINGSQQFFRLEMN